MTRFSEISSIEYQILQVLAEKDNGLSNQSMVDSDIFEHFNRQMSDELSGLCYAGLLEAVPLFGGKFVYKITQRGTEAINYNKFGWIVEQDACSLAEAFIRQSEKNNVIHMRELHKETGWSLRRFNPALAIVLEKIAKENHGRGSDEFVADHVLLNHLDIFALRQYVR